MSKELNQLVQLVSVKMEKISGNKLGEKQYPMVSSRLSRRIAELGFKTPGEYMAHFTQNEMQELDHLVSLLTTHHTFFFREFSQVMMLERYLPGLLKQLKAQGRKHLRVWSAACSFGHEVYTLAMFLERHLVAEFPEFDYRILGTDIDPEAVKTARNGVYKKTDLNKVPLLYSQGLWEKGKSSRLANYVRASSKLKRKCEFGTHNLLKSADHLGSFDLILVRNVLIYFDEHVNRVVAGHFAKALEPHGLLLCGVSETIDTENTTIKKIAPSLYGKTAVQTEVQDEAPKESPRVRRVVCVDDSKSVLKILQKALTPDRGFEVVGTAMNGQEAEAKISQLKPDVVTLDLHMPVMNGIEYLEKNMNDSHPPVVVVSSASREDKETSMRALELGASDFVQKPSLQNFNESADEICSKLDSVLVQKNSNFEMDQSFSESFSSQRRSDEHWICVVADPSDPDASNKLSQLNLNGNKVLFWQSGAVSSFANQTGAKISDVSELLGAEIHKSTGGSQFYQFSTANELNRLCSQGMKVTFLVLGSASHYSQHFQNGVLNPVGVIVEDNTSNVNLSFKADYTVPPASMLYHAHQLQAEETLAA